ncbi:MAG: response regulator [Proteobacteria bacterium]|nr:response regulator [Pseudomonadota bacterium]
MGILAKINILLFISVIALVATSIIAGVFKSQELKYYTLVEEIKTLQIHVTEALALQKNYEKTFSDPELVYGALDKADIYLNKIQVDLLKENAPNIRKVTRLFRFFRNSFGKMVQNVDELLSKKAQINELAAAYSAKTDEVNSRMNEQISAGLLTFTDVDTDLLQVLKNDSLAAFTSINRIVLFINRDLILEGNTTRFHTNYLRAIRDLEIQQKNISIYVLSLEEKSYQELSQQLTEAYKEITLLVPEFEKLNLENRKISQDLQNHKTEISRITQQITHQSELLREEKNKNRTILLLFGQGLIILFLLIGGYLFALSITKPLRRLTKGTREVSDGDYTQELDIARNDEIGHLAHDFNKMRENLKDSFETIDKQKELYQSIFENAIEGIFQTSRDGTVLRTNQAFAEILGYDSPEEMEATVPNITRRFYVNPSDGQTFTELLEKNGFVREFETRLKRKDGKIVTVLINAQVIYDETRKLRFYQGMMEDVTERKRIEEYKIAKEAAEESNRIKSEFLANMSHELRTPLNAILGFSQIMSHDRALNADQKDNLQIINRSGEHLLTLINDILDMSKIEAGQVSLDEKDFDLYQVLNDLQDIFKIKADNKGIEIAFEREPTLPQFVRTDETKLRQVLVNLISNAVKFTRKGSVNVRVSTIEASQLRFDIEDTGPGIAPDDLERLFDPFAQTQTGRDSHEGTGLGLSISRKFVNLMGGDISVKSKTGRGSVFRFSIRVVEGEHSKVEAKSATRRVAALEAGQPTHRILIVDDIETNRQVLASLLSPLGLEIREADSGLGALEIWKEWHPHLIWLDMRMPEMDGFGVIRRIKNSAGGRSPFIVSISASAFEEDRKKAFEAGCDGFVRKPFKEFEIFDEMQMHLGLKYVYEEPIRNGSVERNQKEMKILVSDSMRRISSEWKKNMTQAIEHVDLEKMHALIDQIRAQEPTMADAVQKHIDRFEYDELLDALGK